MKMSVPVCLTATLTLLAALRAQADLLYYDGQTAESAYVNTTHATQSLRYTYAGGRRTMPVSGGKRVAYGAGDPTGNDYLDLNPTAGSVWGTASLFDAASGKIGGGGVEGVLYVSFLIRARVESNGSSENKGVTPGGRYCGFDLYRDSTGVLGMGNHWSAWAYSIYGSGPGDQDLKDESGGTTWINVDRNVHLLVARIAFHANAADDIAVWLDPVPEDGDTQGFPIRRYIASAKGDFSFNRLAYRCGNIPDLTATEFDEVRLGTDWASVTPGADSTYALCYDGQRASSTFVNTSFDPTGLTYTLANGQTLTVTGGKRVAPGSGDAGTDTLPLSPAADSVWDTAGLYDSASGLVGGGEVSATLYFSALVRSKYGATSSTEAKTGAEPYGMEAFVQLNRAGLNNLGALGLGNGWNQHAYSIGGVFGTADLVQTNGLNYVGVNTAPRLLVAKVTFRHNALDQATVWLDPNPDHGDNQEWTVRRATVNGDFSFDRLSYRAGNIPDLNSWDFDEVRFATDWTGLLGLPPPDWKGTMIRVE